jgi:NAD(P)-dependent dehydrogenase (short-subunit alcohol dehydrogenase family)
VTFFSATPGSAKTGQRVKFPVDLVRRAFETNVFAPLELAQKFIRKWVDEKPPGKVVFTSSVAGLISSFRGQVDCSRFLMLRGIFLTLSGNSNSALKSTIQIALMGLYTCQSQ